MKKSALRLPGVEAAAACTVNRDSQFSLCDRGLPLSAESSLRLGLESRYPRKGGGGGKQAVVADYGPRRAGAPPERRLLPFQPPNASPRHVADTWAVRADGLPPRAHSLHRANGAPAGAHGAGFRLSSCPRLPGRVACLLLIFPSGVFHPPR